jgi:hypothetical protein
MWLISGFAMDGNRVALVWMRSGSPTHPAEQYGNSRPGLFSPDQAVVPLGDGDAALSLVSGLRLGSVAGGIVGFDMRLFCARGCG